MTTIKVDATTLKNLGDAHPTSTVSIYDLAGFGISQFIMNDAHNHRRQDLLDYISFLFEGYISKILRSFANRESDIAVRCIFQGDDCPRNFRSVSWESQVGWSDISLIPDLYYFAGKGYHDFLVEDSSLPEWQNRRATVAWRGSSTGRIAGADAPEVGFNVNCLERLPRYQMCRTLQQLGEGADVGFVGVVQCPDHERDFISSRLADEGLLGDYIPLQNMSNYKYIIDIDGNSNSWNFVQRLRLGCCVIKVESPWVQWFSSQIEPWTHYVPVKADLSDLLEKIEWCRTNDNQAQRIAQNGRRFSLDMSFEKEMRKAALTILAASTPLSGRPEDNAILQKLCASVDPEHSIWNVEIEAPPSFPRPFWIKTAHGTILGSPTDGTISQIPLAGDLTTAIMLDDQNTQWRRQLSGYQFDLVGSHLSLHRSGAFLSAENDLVTTSCNRWEKGEWEIFTLVPAEIPRSA